MTEKWRVESETPVFTEEEVYQICGYAIGFFATSLGISVPLSLDTLSEMSAEATARAIPVILSRTLDKE